ncbi:hypothetical protein KP509_01G113100 [Ceratopteris richardii]|uniref:WD repeat-containing protein 44 n=1 Tax=Ceratopteris richardii TaxID=49495 RepID=A0A8T2VQ09_CERRI|nr:hypothetical protein KP509_01G113100 [Ceratopteris richardii]
MDHISYEERRSFFGRVGKTNTSNFIQDSSGAVAADIGNGFDLSMVGSSGHILPASSVGDGREIASKCGIGRSGSIQEGTVTNQSKVIQEDCEMAPDASEVLNSQGVVESVCRIRDRDSGKEFLVITSAKDGSSNGVKELQTGRELTLEEFQSSVGFSPIVQEAMKRERESNHGNGALDIQVDIDLGIEKKKNTWFKAIKDFVNASRDKGHHKTFSSARTGSLEKPGRRSSSESNDGHESPLQPAKRIKVYVHKKSTKDFAHLYLRQEIQAHEGVIWAMKFSPDGAFLASAGQDKVVRVWEVLDHDRSFRSPSSRMGNSFLTEGTKGVDDSLQCNNDLKGSVREGSNTITSSRWNNKPFLLSEKPKHSFFGHYEDVLDLSWSHSQFLLSSSMDKTVRLWNIVSGECSRIFAHNDYVTCIDFNPVDDGYFISGSLDAKVRLWSIKDRQVVDWVDICEMVTAACYLPNGLVDFQSSFFYSWIQNYFFMYSSFLLTENVLPFPQGAAIGSYKGTCHFYKTSENKLQFDKKFEVHRKRKKRSQGKKITGFQVFIPSREDRTLITSGDSRIRVYDGDTVCSKYIGLRNSHSQIAASFSPNGMYVISASEDSRVCIWRYYDSSNSIQKQKSLSRSYEDFFVEDVSIAIPWPGFASQKQLKCKADPGSMRSTDTTPNVSSDGTPGFEGTGKSSVGGSGNVTSVPEDLGESVSTNSTRFFQHSVSNTGTVDSEAISKVVTSPMLESYLEDCCSVLSKVNQHDNQSSSHAHSLEAGGSATSLEDRLGSLSLDGNFSQDSKATCTMIEDGVDNKTSVVTEAMGMIIVTAGLGGEIQVYQNQIPPT